MYCEFYGFTEKPFHITPDPDFLFMSPKHREALACMEYGLLGKVGITLISGEIGIGKTTLIRQLFKTLKPNIRAVCVTNTNTNPEQFLILTANAFGANGHVTNKAEAVKSIQDILNQVHTKKQYPLLIIDDAQNLSLETLGEVTWLSNLQNENGMLLQIMLVGQPELRTKLQQPPMVPLAQRIGINYHLRPLTAEETHEYIVHRLNTVNGPESLFTPEAINLIYATTKGIPRTINLLCDNALVYGFADELPTIDAPCVQQAIDEIGGYGVGFGQSATENSIQEPSTHHPKPATPQLSEGENEEITQRLYKLETRVELLDRVFSLSTKELHETLNYQLAQERLKNDDLLVQLTRLQEKYEALKNKYTAPATPKKK